MRQDLSAATLQPTHPLRRFKQNNTCPLCLAATAGTELVGAIKGQEYYSLLGLQRGLRPSGDQIPRKLSWVRVSSIAQYPRQNSPKPGGAPGRFKSWCGSPFISNLLRISHGLAVIQPSNIIRNWPAKGRNKIFFLWSYLTRTRWSVISPFSPAPRSAKPPVA